MTLQEQFSRDLDTLKSDPAFMTEQLILVITEKICGIMAAQGINRAELAERMGVKPQFITRILNGNPNMTLMTLMRISAAIDAKVEFQLTHKKSVRQRNVLKISDPQYSASEWNGAGSEESAKGGGESKLFIQTRFSVQEELLVLSIAA